MENAHKVIVSREKPAIYARLNAKFGVEWDDDVIIAFEGKIHCKSDVWPQKIIHEKVHLDRQKEIGNDAWWELYLDNETFRFEEEALAYKAEAQFVKRYIKDREARFGMILDIAESFSGSMYGSLITKQEVLNILL